MTIALSTLAAQLAEDLDVEKRASEDGLRNQPPAAASAPSGTEAEIVVRGKQAARSFIDEARGWTAQTEDVFTRLDEQISACSQAQNQAAARASGTGNRLLDSYRRTSAQFEQCQAEYNDFRSEANLQRDASDPSKAAAVMWLISIIIVEGAFNSFVYAATSELGLAGGFYVAFVIGLCNVSFAFIGGFALMRYMFHANPAKKLVGLLGAAATAAICGIILLFAAMYRVGLGLQLAAEHAGTTPVDGWQIALSALQRGNFGIAIATFDSAILLVVGAICMMLGIWKGMFFDDPYPGYGAVGRALENARDDLEDTHDRMVAASDDGGARIAAEVLRRSDALRKLARDAQGESSQLRARMRNLATLQEDWTAELRALVKKYRETNERKRVAASPQYFLEEYPNEAALGHLDGEIAEIQSAPDYARWEKTIAGAERQADSAAQVARELAAAIPSV